MSGSNTTKIVIAVVAMGIAVALVVRSSSSEEQIRAPEGAEPVRFTCEECQHQFEMTPQELYEARNLIKKVRVAERGTRFSVIREKFPCKACKEVVAVLSARCTLHEVIFPTINPDGTRGNCSKCAEEDE